MSFLDAEPKRTYTGKTIEQSDVNDLYTINHAPPASFLSSLGKPDYTNSDETRQFYLVERALPFNEAWIRMQQASQEFNNKTDLLVYVKKGNNAKKTMNMKRATIQLVNVDRDQMVPLTHIQTNQIHNMRIVEAGAAAKGGYASRATNYAVLRKCE